MSIYLVLRRKKKNKNNEENNTKNWIKPQIIQNQKKNSRFKTTKWSKIIVLYVLVSSFGKITITNHFKQCELKKTSKYSHLCTYINRYPVLIIKSSNRRRRMIRIPKIEWSSKSYKTQEKINQVRKQNREEKKKPT